MAIVTGVPMGPPTFRIDDRGALVPCNWTHDVERLPIAGGVLRGFGEPLKLPPYRVNAYRRHQYGRAYRWTRAERRALARVGVRGRRGARRVLPEHRVEVHVYLPVETAADSPALLRQIERVFLDMPASGRIPMSIPGTT